MTYADVLNNLMLMIAKFVKITIDFGEAYVLVKMVLQVFHRCWLTRGTSKAGFYKFAEHFIVNTVEANPIKRMIQNQVAAVEKDIAYLR